MIAPAVLTGLLLPGIGDAGTEAAAAESPAVSLNAFLDLNTLPTATTPGAAPAAESRQEIAVTRGDFGIHPLSGPEQMPVAPRFLGAAPSVPAVALIPPADAEAGPGAAGTEDDTPPPRHLLLPGLASALALAAGIPLVWTRARKRGGPAIQGEITPTRPRSCSRA
jgi:hypothetical protein